MIQKCYVGIDISKEKIDVACIDPHYKVLFEKMICNSESKIRTLLVSVMRKLKLSKEELLVCCEQTGIYNRNLERVCSGMGVTLWVESAFKIKKATSSLRGKSDKMDALRIADYARRYSDKQREYQEPSLDNQRLKILLNARDTVISEISRFSQQINESKDFDSVKYKLLKTCFDRPVKALKKQLSEIEAEINLLVEACPQMQQNAKLLSSIPGIGRQNALAFIVYTQNFKNFSNAKHLACYAGVAPFPNESGTIIKRARVSKLANLKLKSLLHMAAMSCIRAKGELREYYIRKVKEGKNKMLVLNNIRNKLIERMFAVIRRQTEYAENYFEPNACELP
jgi:transposase